MEIYYRCQEVSPMMSLVVPVHVEGEASGGGGLVAVLAAGVRIEGLTVADVAAARPLLRARTAEILRDPRDVPRSVRAGA